MNASGSHIQARVLLINILHGKFYLTLLPREVGTRSSLGAQMVRLGFRAGSFIACLVVGRAQISPSTRWKSSCQSSIIVNEDIIVGERNDMNWGKVSGF